MQRSTPADDAADPLARLAALETTQTDRTDVSSPSAVSASSSTAAVPVVPMVRTSTVDPSIPTGPMPRVPGLGVTAPVVDPSPPPPPVTVQSPTPAVIDTAPPVESTAVVPVLEQGGRGTVIWRRTSRPRVRRVTRVLRHIDTWSVFKVALVFNLIGYVVTLTAAVLLWNVAYRTGTIDNVEKFFEQFGWESFEFRGGELYHNLWVAGLFVAVGLTGVAVMLATLFNLITDLVGGIRVSVLEEEVITRQSATRSNTSSVPRSGAAPVAAEPPDTAGRGSMSG